MNTVSDEAAALARGTDPRRLPRKGWLSPAAPLPFEALWVPYMLAVEKQLLKLLAPFPQCSPHSALRLLLCRLCGISARALYLLYALDRALPCLPEAAQTVDRAGFILPILQSGYRILWEEYPALEALINQACDDCTDSLALLCARLLQDQPLLGPGCLAYDLTALEPGYADPHQGGKTVTRLVFRGGRALYYKPRPTDLQAAFSVLARRLSLVAPRVICRRGYGWAGEITPLLPASIRQAGAYYTRAGILTALGDLLCATDLHRENLVAHGGFPVLVDAETLFHPQVPWAAYPDPLTRTGLVGSKEPYGGLCAFPSYEAGAYTAEFLAGFRLVHHWHRPAHWVRGGILHRLFYRKKLRLLCRDTAEYECLLERALQPKSLLSLENFRQSLQGLYPQNPYREKVLIYKSEERDLLALDIPVFYADTARCQVWDARGTPVWQLPQSPFEAARARALSIDRQGLEDRLALLKQILAAPAPP